ncbi:MAG: class I SAM-dependent methyltransferase [Burkholderiales bacterium]
MSETADSRRRRLVLALALAFALAQGSLAEEEYRPRVGQAGKDVIWVPTPDFLVERMLQMAQAGPRDYVVDLGSGDGRTVILAAKKFRARSLGVEYNPKMVELARRNAEKEGVAGGAKFVEGDIFAFDFGEATVVTLYLLDELNLRLRPRLLAMKPGTRIVSHEFDMGDWSPDETTTVNDHPARLWVVPAKLEGDWKLGYEIGAPAGAVLRFKQSFQHVEGTIVSSVVRLGLREPRLRGDRIEFGLVDFRGVLHEFSGRVRRNLISGSVSSAGAPGRRFRAERIRTGEPYGSPVTPSR